jgi:hypothetical protein
MSTWKTLAGVALVLIAAAVPAAAAAPLKDGDVRIAGRCTGPSTSKLKLSEENGRIEVEFEVDQNRVGRSWAVVLRRNGSVVSRQTRVTRGPSGSFEARLLARNLAGSDRFVATATRPGESCSARASWIR